MRFRLILFLIILSGVLTFAHAQSNGGRISPGFGSGQRWAVVIGISQYKFLPAEQQLKYAAYDAESFAAFLRTHEGGDFDDEHMKVLLDENATARGIRSALGTWLPSRVQDSDTVVLYFVGHGVVEDTQGGAYLAPYDAEPQDLYATAIPLDSISALLQHRITARQVIVMADANHTGHLGRIVVDDKGGSNNAINGAIGHLANERLGVYTITANKTGEPSVASNQYGGGHGVFTYYLLQALKGAADYNKDLVVRADEAYEFVQSAVGRETDGTQHPQQTGRFGNRLALSLVTGSNSASSVAEATEPRNPTRRPDATTSTETRSSDTGTSARTNPPTTNDSSRGNRNTNPPNSTKNADAERRAETRNTEVETTPPTRKSTPRSETPAASATPVVPPMVSNFNLAIERGSLLEPRGHSAWDMYLEMVKGDPNKPELAPIKAKLADALANEGQQIMDRQLNPTQLDLPLTDYQKASSVFAKAYELRPDNPHLNAMQQVSEGRALTILQRYDEAQKALLRAVEIDPSSAVAHMSLGIAYREQQRYFLAERELKRAVEPPDGLVPAALSFGADLRRRKERRRCVA